MILPVENGPIHLSLFTYHLPHALITDSLITDYFWRFPLRVFPFNPSLVPFHH
jgi:hypothetical protein